MSEERFLPWDKFTKNGGKMRPTDNPLYNPLIVSNIFNLMGPNAQEWKTLRLVCKLWNVSGLDYWRNIAKLRIKSSKRDTYIRGIGADEIFELCNETRLQVDPYQFLKKPFSHYKIIDTMAYSFFVEGGGFDLQQKYIWETFGPFMKSLELPSICYFHRDKFITGIKWLLTEACVNLEELYISPHICYEYDAGYLKTRTGVKESKARLNTPLCSLAILNSGNFWSDEEDSNLSVSRELLSMIPNLKHLTLDVTSAGIVAALKYPTKTGNYIKLKTLSLDFTYSPKEGEGRIFLWLTEYMKLAAPQLKYVDIKTDLRNVRQHPFHFHDFIGEIAKTVDKLDLKFILKEKSSCLTDLTGYNYPNLTQLFLTFYENETTCLQSRHGRFDFRCLRYFPKLKALSCRSLSNKISGNQIEIPAVNIKKNIFIPKKQLINSGKCERLNYLKFEFNEDLEDNCHLNHLEFLHFQLSAKFDIYGLRVIGRWAKNLTNLETILDEATFPIVFKIWPGLKKLSLLENSTVRPELVTLQRQLHPKICIES